MHVNAICGQCGESVPAGELQYTLVGSYCRRCHVAETADIAQRERQLMRSIGWRALIVGILMLAIGIAVLSLGVAGTSSFAVIPAGMLIGGLVECVRGLSKLSSYP